MLQQAPLMSLCHLLALPIDRLMKQSPTSKQEQSTSNNRATVYHRWQPCLGYLFASIRKTMGLHRDGTIFGLKPFEPELRRRLWWHICILDSRSSEYHGYEPIVNGASFDTQLPLQINDSDLLPVMTDPPVYRADSTDMTLCLIRCEALRIG